jgi:hypothetical protein
MRIGIGDPPPFQIRGSDYPGSTCTKSAMDIHVAFLLRLGEGKFAEEMWDAGYSDQGNIPAPDPYVDMAGIR